MKFRCAIATVILLATKSRKKQDAKTCASCAKVYLDIYLDIYIDIHFNIYVDVYLPFIYIFT